MNVAIHIRQAGVWEFSPWSDRRWTWTWVRSKGLGNSTSRTVGILIWSKFLKKIFMKSIIRSITYFFLQILKFFISLEKITSRARIGISCPFQQTFMNVSKHSKNPLSTFTYHSKPLKAKIIHFPPSLRRSGPGVPLPMPLTRRYQTKMWIKFGDGKTFLGDGETFPFLLMFER